MRGGKLIRCSTMAAALVSLGALSAAPAADLPRIVSMNVCTDELLRSVADPEQIVGLSRLSRNQPSEGQARHFSVLSGGAEDVLALKPDIVLASTFDKRATRELLKQHGVHVVEFPLPRNL